MNKSSESYLLLDKANLRKITMVELAAYLPDLKNSFEAKSIIIANWIIDMIKNGISSEKFKETDLLPQKSEMAYHLGVSIGTIQNALRHVEDKGFVESKQCIGTMIRDWKKPLATVRKLTSKRDVCVNSIKKYIIENKVKAGDSLPSTRVLAGKIGCSANTTRLALENLCSCNIIAHDFRASKNSSWVLKSNNISITKKEAEIENSTLVEKIEKDIENYISKNMKIGDKIPAHEDLSAMLKVSIKTIHDSLKSLIKKGILLARRGRYGTTVIKMPHESAFEPKKETSIFASAQETAFYNYEKTQNHIKALIANNYEIGEKLPSISELSMHLDLSPNTIRKALNNLAKEGYLRFERGRYGGTIIIDIPETTTQAFKWLAVNPKYVEVYK